jgi:hypothetical protein
MNNKREKEKRALELEKQWREFWSIFGAED